MKPNKTAIADDLRELLKWNKKRLGIEADRDIALDPHVTRFENATATIRETAEKALAEIAPKIEAPRKRIEAALLAGVDPDTGAIALQQVEATAGKWTAMATVNNKPGSRVVDPQKFFTFTPPAKRVKQFWDCVTIGVAKAKEFFGEQTLDTMATKPTKPTKPVVDIKVSHQAK